MCRSRTQTKVYIENENAQCRKTGIKRIKCAPNAESVMHRARTRLKVKECKAC